MVRFESGTRICRLVATGKGFLALAGFLLIAFSMISVSAHSQAWSGILDPSRAIDWTKAGIPGGIPNRTTVCRAVAPSGEANATDSANIQNALTACAGTDQVVQLQAGKYTLAAGILFNQVSHVVLRGAGPDKTTLAFTGLAGCGQHSDVCLYGGDGWMNRYTGATTWTGGYAQGSTTLTVGSTTGMSATPGAPGNIIFLDQRSDEIGICPVSGGRGNCTVPGARSSGTTATIVTSLPHRFAVGNKVAIGAVGVAGYNTMSNTSSACDNTVGCQWWTITDVGCINSGRYVSEPSCGASPIIAFQYITVDSNLGVSGGGFAAVDTGGVFYGGTIHSILSAGEAEGSRTCPGSNLGPAGNPECATGEISRRPQIEAHQVTSIPDGTHITISPPIMNTNWRNSQNPAIWWSAKSMQNGVEAMTLDFTNDGGGSGNGGVTFYNCFQCWEKNVRSINGSRNHVWVQYSMQVQVESSYFYGQKGNHSKSYAIELSPADSFTLIQNNICQHVVSCIMMAGDYGSVISYNYMIDSGYTPPLWNIGMLAANHGYSGFNLYEGNDTNEIFLDNTHGTGSQQTFFRNRMRGFDTPPRTNPGSLQAVFNSAFNRANNYIGNILGWPSWETTYQTTSGPPLFSANTVWELNQQGGHDYVPPDPIVSRSLLRWGNYDTATGAVRWCATGAEASCGGVSEIPTTGVSYVNGNAVPADHAVPNSFYLPNPPSWWSTPWKTPKWPPVGPDVTGGTAPDSVGGYSDAIPAQLCYANIPVDPAYEKTYRVTDASWSSGIATLTIGTHTLSESDTIIVSGMGTSGYNGTFAVMSGGRSGAQATSTTVSYSAPTNPGTYTPGGSVTYPHIRLFNAAQCYPGAYGGVSSPTNVKPVAPPTNVKAVPH
jgi:hypothetical protein